MEEGEEGVIGRLRCDVSTFLASETAKRPPAGLPTSRGSQRRGWGCWSLLNRRLALWAPTPAGVPLLPSGGQLLPPGFGAHSPRVSSRYLPEVVGWEFPEAASEGGAALQGRGGLGQDCPATAWLPLPALWPLGMRG